MYKGKRERIELFKSMFRAKRKRTKIYIDKSLNSKIIISNRKTNNIKTEERKEKELYEQIDIYHKEFESKNKEITILKKRILTLVAYLKRKDKNILILDNNIEYMFYACSSLTSLNISNFTSKVRNLTGIFSNCNKLTFIDISNFSTDSVNNKDNFIFA